MGHYEDILTETSNGILTITLNRPDRLNAWTGRMHEEVRDAIVNAGQSPDIRCIVVTGAGRGFCAGADMTGLQEIQPGDSGSTTPAPSIQPAQFDDAPGPDPSPFYQGRFGYLYACPKPIIAKINGPCAGIGLIFALYADLRYADETAKFTTAFAQRGLIAEHGISWLLPRLVGEANALDLLLTARKFLGDEAAQMGLVNAAMSGETLNSHVEAVANHLAHQVSPRSVAIMKRQIRTAYFQSFNEALNVADREMEASFATHDFKEGVNSFVERRPPAFTGT